MYGGQKKPERGKCDAVAALHRGFYGVLNFGFEFHGLMIFI
jgi:hypothetical protein